MIYVPPNFVLINWWNLTQMHTTIIDLGARA